MKIGMAVRNMGPACMRAVTEVPRELEKLGYNSIWFTDHVVGVRSYQPVYGPEWAEALTSLAFTASATRHIRIGVSVLVVPSRDPVYAAKALATIDHLSGGRLDVGLGTGWAKSEFHGLGRGHLFEERGRFTDEAIEVMIRCWEGGEFGWDGEWVKFRRIEVEPPALQRPHPPLWVGGYTGRALRRAARWADVWHPTTGIEPEQLRDAGDRLNEMAGREVPICARRRIPVTTSLGDVEALLDRYEIAGCAAMILEIAGDDVEDYLDLCGRLADRRRLAAGS